MSQPKYREVSLVSFFFYCEQNCLTAAIYPIHLERYIQNVHPDIAAVVPAVSG